MNRVRQIVTALSMTTMLAATHACAYSAQERIDDMRAMESALQQMQKGFLYNNLKDIEAGAELLKTHAARIEPPVSSDTDSFKRSYAYDLTKREAAKIISYADDAVEEYKKHKPKKAMNDFTKILKQCMTCHARIRKW